MYHVVYTDKCVISIKTFNDRDRRDAWVLNFLLQNQTNEDNNIDFVFDGTLCYSSITSNGTVKGASNGLIVED